MNHEIIPSYGVYQNAIDLTLYHAFAELVVETSQDDKARTTYRQIRAEQIWQPESDTSTYFEQYGLRYPGEVLERFEEKLGNNLRTLPCTSSWSGSFRWAIPCRWNRTVGCWSGLSIFMRGM